MFIFEWDDKKAETNKKKHGVTFDEAITVFYDDFAASSTIQTIQKSKTASSSSDFPLPRNF